jgi:hypothetical protein
MTRVALTTMLKVIGRLDNLRPAPVSIGKERTTSQVKKIVKEFEPGDSATLPESWHYHIYLTEDWDGFFPFPTSKFAQILFSRLESVTVPTLTFFHSSENQLGRRCAGR